MLKKGVRVKVVFDDKEYFGVIAKCHNNKTYDVDCDDGDCIDHCPEADIEVCEVPVPNVAEITKPPDKIPQTPAKPNLTTEELERKVDEDRKKTVDKKNVAKAAKEKAEDDALAGVPLTAQEKAFIARIAPRMNCGRIGSMPSAADITRYARLANRGKK